MGEGEAVQLYFISMDSSDPMIMTHDYDRIYRIFLSVATIATDFSFTCLLGAAGMA
jgi:hypothetical protein